MVLMKTKPWKKLISDDPTYLMSRYQFSVYGNGLKKTHWQSEMHMDRYLIRSRFERQPWFTLHSRVSFQFRSPSDLGIKKTQRNQITSYRKNKLSLQFLSSFFFFVDFVFSSFISAHGLSPPALTSFFFFFSYLIIIADRKRLVSTYQKIISSG